VRQDSSARARAVRRRAVTGARARAGAGRRSDRAARAVCGRGHRRAGVDADAERFGEGGCAGPSSTCSLTSRPPSKRSPRAGFCSVLIGPFARSPPATRAGWRLPKRLVAPLTGGGARAHSGRDGGRGVSVSVRPSGRVSGILAPPAAAGIVRPVPRGGGGFGDRPLSLPSAARRAPWQRLSAPPRRRHLRSGRSYDPSR
jgi:hypothetical protein